MSIPVTERLGGDILFAPITGQATGLAFTVGLRSVVCRLITPTGEAVGVDDAFELRSVLAYNKDTGVVSRSYAIKELDPIGGTSFGLLLGANMTQAEIVIRGTYAWKKTINTTPAVGIEGMTGYEKK